MNKNTYCPSLPCMAGETVYILTGLDGCHVTKTTVLWFEIHPDTIIAYTESHGDVSAEKLFTSEDAAREAAEEKRIKFYTEDLENERR